MIEEIAECLGGGKGVGTSGDGSDKGFIVGGKDGEKINNKLEFGERMANDMKRSREGFSFVEIIRDRIIILLQGSEL